MTRSIEAVDVRCARDRVIDLLGFAQTFPVRDVQVTETQLSVNLGEPCEIAIDPGQAGVEYTLLEAPGTYSARGTGEKIVLRGPIIQPGDADKTYNIRATKVDAPDRSRDLLATATVKVGLDPSLPVSMPAFDTYRGYGVVAYGESVKVFVDRSQAGSKYRLVTVDEKGNTVTPIPMKPDALVRGTGARITLETTPLFDDMPKLQVEVTRAELNLEAILDGFVRIAVAPQTNLEVSVTNAPIEPGGKAVLKIAASQKGVRYSVVTRPIGRVEFVPVPDREALALHGANVLVYPAGDAGKYDDKAETVTGTGGDIELPVNTDDQDFLASVYAEKDVSFDASRPHAARCIATLAIAIRPKPRPNLTLTLVRSADGKSGALEVRGGQPGVFYHFYDPETGNELGDPAYFHEPDVGIASNHESRLALTVGANFVVTRDANGGDPIVTISPLPKDDQVAVMALHMRTKVEWAKRVPMTMKATP